jgi:CHAT domain-containing protein
MSDISVKLALLDDEYVEYTGASEIATKSRISSGALSKELIKRFNHWIADDNTRYERLDFQLLGQLLYETLFPAHSDPGAHSIRRLFEADYVQFYNQTPASESDRFRLTLELHERASVLAAYPWEFVYVPEETASGTRLVDGGFFLVGGRNKLILTRFVPTAPPAKLLAKEGEPLRILVVYSHPDSLDAIDSKSTKEVIEVIQHLTDLGDVEVRLEDNITFNALKQLMNSSPSQADSEKPSDERYSFRPDILHFIGHGRPNALALVRDPKDMLVEEDKKGHDSGDADWRDGSDILRLFAEHTPRLVFLHACEGAQVDSVGGFRDLARTLVYAKIPSVIAMQYTIKNKDAGVFAKKFYSEIRNGSLLDEAVRAARAELAVAQDKKAEFSDRRFGTPVVYFQQESREPIIKVRKAERRSVEHPLSSVEAASGAASHMAQRVCPRCGQVAQSFCTVCGLYFTCPNENCKQPLINPLGTFCGNCGQPFKQPTYAPDVASEASSSFPAQRAGTGFGKLFPSTGEDATPGSGLNDRHSPPIETHDVQRH